MEALKEFDHYEEPDPFDADIDEGVLVTDAFDFLFDEDAIGRVSDKEKDSKD